MTPTEWRKLAHAINSDIASLTRASHTERQVKTAISDRIANPTEQYFIDEDFVGSSPAEPRIVEFAGVQVKVWKIHRAGMQCRDIKGADLFYELPDQTFALVHDKKPGAGKRISLDSEQLDELQKACPTQCPPSNRFSCGAWFAIRDSVNAEFFSSVRSENSVWEVQQSQSRAFRKPSDSGPFLRRFWTLLCWWTDKTIGCGFL